MCVQGARWAQSEVMDKYVDEDLKAYVVWMPMLASDERDKWKASLLDDPRMTHFWNENQAVGRWFTENLESCDVLGPVAWDAYYLYDEAATWEDALSPVVVCGTPVFRATKTLAEALEQMFGSED